jgi:hypothetical protein
VIALAFVSLTCCVFGKDRRIDISLNGTWQIDESVAASDTPRMYRHRVVVPGLVNLSSPPFPEVDYFASREYLQRWGRYYPLGHGGSQILSDSAPLPAVGVSAQKRNYFWYRTTFAVSTKKEVAILKIGKAQFGVAVWLNGTQVGERFSCWTAGHFDLTDAIHWQGENHLLVRIGAHPGVIPEDRPAGCSAGKQRWSPGIYDNVTVSLCDNPVIESVQVAPQPDSASVVIQTKVKNYGEPRRYEIHHEIKTWKERLDVLQSEPLYGRLEAGEEKNVVQAVHIPNVQKWSPESPFLYSLNTSTEGDSAQTRFGVRDFRFDGAAQRAYLNGKPIFLRGGNIELNQFLENPDCGDKPWDPHWVRKLVGKIPKRLNWNAFRICLSPVPEMWLDIADEEGILIQYEPPIWAWDYHTHWDTSRMIEEFGSWMQDNWNHPSIFMWDCNNETVSPEFATIVNAVRRRDLSNRGWDSSWSPPAGPNDPVEMHAYILARSQDLRGLNHLDGLSYLRKTWKAPLNHAYILNEYCWLWLYSDGEPLRNITDRIYKQLVPNGSAKDRIECRWYLTAALTEWWRTQRCAVGVLLYPYLGSFLERGAPGPYDYGAFDDTTALRLQPDFEHYMSEAFRPLGVCINFWGDGKPTDSLRQVFPVHAESEHKFSITVINDDHEPVNGDLIVSLEDAKGAPLATRRLPFHIAGAGREVYEVVLPIPKNTGGHASTIISDDVAKHLLRAAPEEPEETVQYLLKAVASPSGTRHTSATTCRRKLCVVEPN